MHVPGSNFYPEFSMDELIDYSSHIFIVEAERGEGILHTYRGGTLEETLIPVVQYNFRIIEVVKGEEMELTPHTVYPRHLGGQRQPTYKGSDFNQHSDPDFWKKKIGRSDERETSCGLVALHTFKDGHRYLYFPDILWGMKSAELIRSEDDKWFQYVRERVASAAVEQAGAN